MDAIKTSKRAEKTVENVIIMIRDGTGVDSECGEGATNVVVRWVSVVGISGAVPFGA
jgi:hypothetical protein